VQNNARDGVGVKQRFGWGDRGVWGKVRAAMEERDGLCEGFFGFGTQHVSSVEVLQDVASGKTIRARRLLPELVVQLPQVVEGRVRRRAQRNALCSLVKQSFSEAIDILH